MAKACVVGANRGIGLAFCSELKNQGYEVFALCRKSNPQLDALGVQVIEGVEVTDEKSMKDAASKMGSGQIDLFLHVAGIMRRTAFADFDEDHIMEQLQVNSLGPLLSFRQFKTCLTPTAKVAFLTSRMGSIADNDSGGAYGYRMSKSALNAAVKSLSLDFKESQWTILTMHPGWVKTDMTGGSGLLTSEQSVKDMLAVIDSKSTDHSGRFFHSNGEELPW